MVNRHRQTPHVRVQSLPAPRHALKIWQTESIHVPDDSDGGSNKAGVVTQTPCKFHLIGRKYLFTASNKMNELLSYASVERIDGEAIWHVNWLMMNYGK
jgi:hypothetical protein